LSTAVGGATFDFGSGVAEWSSGNWSLGNGLTNVGELTVNGTSDRFFTSGSFENRGHVIHQSGRIYLNGNTISNPAAHAGLGLSAGLWEGRGGVVDNWANGVFSNAGQLVKTGAGNYAIVVSTTNAGGLVEVNAGTLSFSGPQYVQSGGITRLAGGALSASGGVNIQGGRLEGAGTISANVTNAGTLAPGVGGPGTLIITGNYAQTAAGIYEAEIDGADAGLFDVVQVNGNGNANLNGELRIQVDPAFAPAQGNEYRVMTFGSRTNDFALVTGLTSAPGVTLDKTISNIAVTINAVVAPINQAPDAVFDSYGAPEDTAFTFDVLANDTDPNVDALVVASFTLPVNGTLTHNGGGSFTFTPNRDFFGTDGFTYVVSDRRGGTDTGTVNLVSSAVNDAPVVRAYASGRALDFDGVDDRVVVGDPANGVLDLGSQSTIEAWVKFDALPVSSIATIATKNEGPGNQNKWVFGYANNYFGVANATIFHINSPASGPIFLASSAWTPIVGQWYHLAVVKNGTGYQFYRDGALQGTATTNVAVPDVNALLIFGETENGFRLNGALDEVRIWQTARTAADIRTDMSSASTGAEAGLAGYWRFEEGAGGTVFDRSLNGNHGSLGGGVAAAMPQFGSSGAQVYNAVTTDPDTDVTMVLGATDVDGDALQVFVTSLPENGRLFQTADGMTRGAQIVASSQVTDAQHRVIYVPNTGAFGVPFDSFEFSASDGQTSAEPATVTIDVVTSNAAPVAVNDTATVLEDQGVAVDVRANDSDPDFDQLAIAGFTQPAHGETYLDGVAIRYIPDANYFGPDVFFYTLDDGRGGRAVGRVDVTVQPVNDRPTAASATVTTPELTDILITLNGSDIDGDTLAAIVQSLPAHGTLYQTSDGTTRGAVVTAGATVTDAQRRVIYAPAPGAGTAFDAFSFVLSDGQLQSAAATVTIDVTATISPHVVASSIVNGANVAAGPLTYTATFSESLATAGLDAADVVLRNTSTNTNVAASAFAYDDATRTLTLTFPALGPGNYTLTLISAANAFRDLDGRTLDGSPSFPLPSGDGQPGGNFVVGFFVPAPDLAASDLVVPATGRGGQTVQIGWTVTNLGTVPTPAAGWVDQIVLSSNNVFGDVDDEVLVSFEHGDPLAVGASYTELRDVLLPAGREGNYFIGVRTDGTNLVAELVGNDANDRTALAPIALTSPFADLEVVIVGAPASARVGESIDVSWRVRNSGDTTTGATAWNDLVVLSADQIYDGNDLILATAARPNALAPGEAYDVVRSVNLTSTALGTWHVLVVTNANNTVFEKGQTVNNIGRATGQIVVSPAPAPDLGVSDIVVPATGNAGEQRSVQWTVTNTGDATARGPWTDLVYLSFDGTLNGATQLASVVRSADLAANASYTGSTTVTLPDLADGSYRIVVVTDANTQVFEDGRESNNTAASANTVALTHPDLDVTDVVVPALPNSGSTFDVAWTVKNIGSGPAGGTWTDTLWLSRDGTLDSGDLKLADVVRTGPLASDGSYTGTTAITLPLDANGSYQLLVISDSGNTVRELAAGETNNLGAAPLNVALAPYADLRVSNVIAPNETIGDPAQVTIRWTVDNNGTGPGQTASWTDAIIASKNGVLGDGDDVVLKSFEHQGTLAVGASYTREETFLLPPGFNGRYTLFVKTDAGGQVFENGFEANNAAAAPAFFDVMTIPYADLVVTSLVPQAVGQSGQPFEIAWTIRNQGIGQTSTAAWFDHVYISDDTIIGDADDQLLGSFNHFGFLSAGESYTRSVDVTLANGISGTRYVYLKTGGPFEFVYDNNNQRISDPFTVQLSPSPDLVVSDITAPAQGAEGSAIDVSWTVRNQGAADATGVWIDRVYLRQFGDTGPGTLIGTYTYQGPLQAGQTYSRREQITLPTHTSQHYEIVVFTDAANDVYEHGTGEQNTRSVDDTQISVTVLPRSDLQIGTVTVPPVLTSGATASVEFTVINQGPVATTVPNWNDRVYLSLDDRITSDDILVANLTNASALPAADQPDNEYVQTTGQFQIPLRFRGNVYLLIMTDYGGAVDEWPNDANNTRIQPIFVTPVPFADIVVSEVVAPAQAFEGNTIEVRYTVTNKGAGDSNLGAWTEQIWLTRDKNRPHPGQGDVLLQTLQYTGGILERNEGYDRVLTVRLPDHVVSGTYYIMPWVDPYALLLEDTLASNVNPDDPSEINNNNYKARAIDLIGIPVEVQEQIKPPPADLAVSGVVTEATELGGGLLTFSWTVTNTGAGATITGWRDRVVLSDSATLDAPGAKQYELGEFSNMKVLAPNQSYTNTQTVLLNPSAKGRYLHVMSSIGGDTNPANNVGTAATNVTDPLPDLRVTSIVTPPSVDSGEKTRITYTVTNEGSAPVWSGTQYWTDYVYLSKDPTFIIDRATLLAQVKQPNSTPLGAGASYTRNVDIELPPGIGGSYYIYVLANVVNPQFPMSPPWPVVNGDNGRLIAERYTTAAYENPLNNLGQAALPVMYREPDLRVTNLSIPDTIAAGTTLDVSFTVTNTGNRATRETSWIDTLYLSLDPSLDSGDYLIPGALISGGRPATGGLAAGASYTTTMRVTIPFDITGTFYLLAYTDADAGKNDYARSTVSPRLSGIALANLVGVNAGSVREFQGEGNNIANRAIAVTPYAAPDLRVTALTAPERVVRGQQFDVSYTVTNQGGDTPPQQANWDDLVYLSRDAFLDTKADRFIGSIRHAGGLAAGQSYSIDRTYTVPTDLATEAYYVFVVSDPTRYGPTGEVFEGANERNNDRASAVPMIIELPPPTDLVVTNVVIPPEARSGEPLVVQWTVKNQSGVPASGTWTDSVFLSTDATWDIGDRSLGRVQYTGATLQPDGTYTLSLTTTMPPAAPGSYRVIVRTDIFNQVHEGINETNNRTASASNLTVAVDELVIGAPLTTTLKPGQEKLYQITVPRDQTLRVLLNASDDKSTNEIYLRHGAVPTSANFDATYNGPLASDLTAIVPSTQPGIYYLLVRNFNAPASGVEIQLLAQLLPLVITDVHTDVGGDSRYVTTTILGAQFSDDAIVKLVRPGIAEYEPLVWDVIDSSKIIATFDFTGAPHGLYDLKVINPSGDTAVVPYRFLVERAIEPEVTIGIGGPRVILAGDQATYSVALQNLSNLDAPYTYFEIGVPQLNSNPWVYNLPFLEYFTNVRGDPEGAAGSDNAGVPWVQMESIINSGAVGDPKGGQLIASGFLFDQPADGFGGFSFNVTTYPGLRELHDRAFNAFRARMAAFFPGLDEHLEGGAGGLGEWWEAVKAEIAKVSPGVANELDKLDFLGLYNQNAAVPDENTIPFIPFRFHVVATATTMTRAEFVAFQSNEARELRTSILASSTAPGALLALAANEQTWVDLYLAALEDAQLLRPDGETPPIRTQQHIVSLMTTLASGILFGPAGSEIRSDGNLLGFFEKLRELYGHDQDRMADIEFWDPRESDLYIGEVPVPRLPDFGDYDLGLTTQTHFEAFRIYVPWMAFEDRGSGVPTDFQINGPEPVDGSEFAQLDFTNLLKGNVGTGRLASITGPQTFDTGGWLPVGQTLPYTVNFANDPASGRYINEVRVVTQLDPDVDARSFKLGDIKIGDITIDVPDGRSLFQGEFDFVASRGFLLRVSAGIDLFQDVPAATWLIQAIDPLTGEVLQDATRGLLKPNDALGNGAGYVSYSVEASTDLDTGAEISASARVLFDTQAPEDTLVLTHQVDGRAPITTIDIERIGTSSSFEVSWESTDDPLGSGFKHVTLYVATDSGDFKIWQRQLTTAAGSLVFAGQAGHTYEFIALATDMAGNREAPQAGVNAQADDSGVNLGALPTVPGTTPANFGVAPTPAPQPSTNDLFQEASAAIPSAPPATAPSDFDTVIAPFVAQVFATGIGQSHAGIGPMAIVERPDGSFLISGGSNRGQIFLFDDDGGAAGTTPWASLDEPIFNLAYDAEGRLWATTGGGALLQLDGQTGAVVARHGDGITIALAVDPSSGRIYVSTNAGVQIFDPDTGLFTQFSRDRNLRVGSLAFDNQGRLWAATWPDRSQVVRFTDRGRAEIMLEFDSAIDSIAFGKAGTALADLLFVSHNSGPISDTGAAEVNADLTMVDVATLQRIAVARGGTRGDVVITTTDGRVLLSQSDQVDVLNPAFAPSVVASLPVPGAILPLPLPFISLTFDQDMYIGAATDSDSILNPTNYRLVGAGTGVHVIQHLVYDAATRTVLLNVGNLMPDAYTLTIDDRVKSVFGKHLVTDHVTTFEAISDLTAYIDIEFGATRFDRTLNTVSYDVTITNTGDMAIILPMLLVLDPRDGYAGIPNGLTAPSDDGRWLINLKDALPAGNRLERGQSISGFTISVKTPDRRRVDFDTGVSAGSELNHAPAFDTDPPLQAQVGTPFTYDANASDADGHTIAYHLLTGPTGMTIDAASGMVSWNVAAGTVAEVPVVIQAFDTRGAVALQRFVLTVAGGNRAPAFIAMPTEMTGREGDTLALTVVAVDPEQAPLTLWADHLPPGAVFDAATRTFTWTPDYHAAGTYPDVTFFASDGVSIASATVTIRVSEGYRLPVLIKPADRSVQEGDTIRFTLQASGDESAVLTYSADYLPFGATLHPVSGLFEWTPGFTQAGTYEIPFVVGDKLFSHTVKTTITVTNANGAPVLDPQDGWEIYEGQPVVIKAFAYDPDNPFYEPPFRDAQGNLVENPGLRRSVTVTATNVPSWATFDPLTYELRGTPTHRDAGEYVIHLTAVDDGDGTGTPLTHTLDMPIRVLNVNRAPVIEAIANVELARDAVREITVQAADPEGNPIAMLATSEQPGFPLPSFMSFTDHGNGTGTLRIAPKVGDRGDHVVRIIAADDGDGGTSPVRTSSYTFNVKATSANEPPQIAYLGDAVAVIGQKFTLLVDATDMDQDPLGFELSGLPTDALKLPTPIVYGRAVIEWTPQAADAGARDVTLTVRDSGNGNAALIASSSRSFRLTVRAANDAPVLAPIGAKSVNEGQTLSIQLQASDPNGDKLTYSVVRAPDGLVMPKGVSIDPATGLFTWKPALNTAGTYQFAFGASDGSARAAETITVTVTNTNQLPVFVPMFPQLAREGAEFKFAVAVADPDADPVVLSVSNGMPVGALFVPARGEFIWTPTFDQQGTHVVTFTALDPSGIPVHMDVEIRVGNVNRAPVLDESDHSFLIGETKSFLIQATDADAGTDLTFAAIDLPDGATLDAQTGRLEWTPGPGQTGQYIVTLIARDESTETRQSIVLRASLEPIEPTVHIELTPSFAVLPGANVLVHVIADSFSEIQSLKLFVGGQEVALDANGRAFIKAPAPGKLTLTAEAIDADGVKGSTSTQLKVRDANDKLAPIVAFAPTLDNARLHAALALLGQVQDSNLDFWQLTIASDSSGAQQLLAAGEGAIDGALVDFDPRRWLDGFYTLTLTARDIGGRTSVTSVGVEVDTASKLGQYERKDEDLTVSLGGMSFTLARHYDALSSALDGSFGPAWDLVGRDVHLETNVPSTGREALGVYSSYADGTRVYLDLPNGERAGFSFLPIATVIGGNTFYRPAWLAHDAHGFTLTSTDTLLTKAGARYYDAGTGQPYNPQSSFFTGADFTLTAPAPDGTQYLIDAASGIQEIRKGGQRLFVSDNAVTAESGATLQFVRDAEGRITRAIAPNGTTIVYLYDGGGNLSAVRNLSTGAGYRYTYDNGLLTGSVRIGGAGESIAYHADGSVSVQAVTADLGGLTQFTGEVAAESLGAGASDLYTFSIRASEIAATSGGQLILRVAIDAAAGLNLADPAVLGMTPLSVERTDNRIVALFGFTQEGLYQLRIAGTGASSGSYELRMAAAGDLDLDGDVDGTDSAAFAASAAGADITGDGATNGEDRSVLFSNFGFAQNQGPIVATTLPAVLTHEELPVRIELASIATDPNGDQVFYRILSSEHGTATLSADARYVIFTPHGGYTGAASFVIRADDGFNASPEAIVGVTVSDAPLIAIDFDHRRLMMDIGETEIIRVIGDFADQQDVELPLAYVNARVLAPTIASLTPQGALSALSNGYTVLAAERGRVSAATVVGVGDAPAGILTLTQFSGIDAYPDAVTIVPTGGERQIIVSIGSTGLTFVGKASDGTRYYSGNEAVATVTADGLIRAVAPGETTMTVIHAYGEEVIQVKVEAPVPGNTQVGADGGVILGEGGIIAAFGSGQLSGDATVTITQVAEANLPAPMPTNPSGEQTFDYVGAFELNIQGAELNGPIQVAVPIAPGSAAPGDTVYFMTKATLPVGPNGELMDVWSVVDSGVVGADGMARTASPPFPGLSDRGSVLIARAAQPLGIVRMDIGLMAGVAIGFAVAAGVAASAGLAGSVAAIGLVGIYSQILVLPAVYDINQIRIWREWAGKSQTSMFEINVPPGSPTITAFPQLPPISPNAGPGDPVVTHVDPPVIGADGVVTVSIYGNNFFDPNEAIADDIRESRIAIKLGSRVEYIRGADYTAAEKLGAAGGKITFTLPDTILAGKAELSLERRKYSSGASDPVWIASQSFTLVNKGGYGFVGIQGSSTGAVEVIDTSRPDEVGATEEVIKRIEIGDLGTVWDSLSMPDLSAVYFASDRGVLVIDGLTLQQFDADPDKAGKNLIAIPGDGRTTALALDPKGRYLYAAGTDSIHVIDIRPGSATYHKVVDTMHGLQAHANGRINGLAVSADGKFLFATAPDTTLFGPGSFTTGHNKDGFVVVFNVNEEDRPGTNEPNTRRYRERIALLEGGLEPWDIKATSEADKLIFTSRLDLEHGLRTITIRNPDPLNFKADVKEISLKLNTDDVGVRYVGTGTGDAYFPTFSSRTGQYWDMDVRNASSVVVTPTLDYAFVADWYVPRLYYVGNPYLAVEIEDLHGVGSKIGVVRNPFGDPEFEGSEKDTKILAATTPIPMAFLEDIVLDPTGKKLYAHFRNAGNVAVYDVDGMIARAETEPAHLFDFGAKDWHTTPLDGVQQDAYYGNTFNLPAIDVSRAGRTLALQSATVLELVSPTGSLDSDDPSEAPIEFEWRVDTDMLGVKPDTITTKLYISALAPGDGLWPDDEWRERRETVGGFDLDDPPSISESADPNPGRILTSPSLKLGYKYKYEYDAASKRMKFDAGTPIAGKPDTVIVEVSHVLRKALTAGQRYYWGVEVENSAGISQSALFTAENVETTRPYSAVTILTHGFQLDPVSDFTGANFQQPIAFMDLGHLIAEAGGGGVVLSYDKLTGEWVDRETGLTGRDALILGKPIVLISDWYNESDISDSGFAEAAADALFASLVDLDSRVDGDIFASPLHFIGHSRGTVVNSEIIQRIGWYKLPADQIYMTTLDIHDFEQKSLDVPLGKLLEGISTALTIATGVSVVAAPYATPFLMELKGMIETATTIAGVAGIALDVPYADFKDPDVQIWANVDFADNYYQKGADESADGLVFAHVTATPNGRLLPGADINRSFDSNAGFGREDFQSLNFGLGGTHSRVWQWYAGTVNTNILEFAGNPIFRTIGDEGYAVDALGFPLPGFTFTDVSWYHSNPEWIIPDIARRTTYTNFDLLSQGYEPVIREGITNGWYFSPLGGGANFLPDKNTTGIPITQDNTEVTQGTQAVPGVINGDFESGTRQSLLNRLLPTGDKGRFPFSYELPGWSFHGGEGFHFENGFTVADILHVPDFDITGLFVMETNPTSLFTALVNKVWDWAAGKIMEMIGNKVKTDLLGVPTKPGADASPEEQAWYHNFWEKEGAPGKQIADAGVGIFNLFDSFMSSLATKGLQKLNIEDLFSISADGKKLNPIGIQAMKEYITKGIELRLKELYPTTSDFALLMGGGQVLTDVLAGQVGPFAPFIPADMQGFIGDVIDFVSDFDTVTHNRMYIPTDQPYLAFEVFTPFMITDDARLTITFRGAGEAEGVEFIADPIKLEPGFLEKRTYSVKVPEILKGKMATISFSHSSARRAIGTASSAIRNVAKVPAMKLPIAAIPSAAPARPCRAIWNPSSAVTTDVASPGMFTRIAVVEPPYCAP